jgi:hypothetical protein
MISRKAVISVGLRTIPDITTKEIELYKTGRLSFGALI